MINACPLLNDVPIQDNFQETSPDVTLVEQQLSENEPTSDSREEPAQ